MYILLVEQAAAWQQVAKACNTYADSASVALRQMFNKNEFDAEMLKRCTGEQAINVFVNE